MRCIQCGTNNGLRQLDRNAGRCQRCSHRYVFNAYNSGIETSGYRTKPITDVFFNHTIHRLSADGQLFFTFNQLLYHLNKRILPEPLFPSILEYVRRDFSVNSFARNSASEFNQPVTVAVLTVILWAGLFGLGLHETLGLAGLAVCPVIAVLLSIYLKRLVEQNRVRQAQERLRRQQQFELDEESRRRQVERQNELARQTLERFRKGQYSRTKLVSEQTLREWLRRWQAVNGPVQKLLVPADSAQARTSSSPDVTAYSFDRLVVCQSNLIAHLLIANQFHFENNCAILSINGYPQPIFDTVMQMVRRNTDLQVYAFHDCSPEGMGLVHQIQTSDRWFQGHEVTIIDTGLRPQQVLEAARSSRSGQNFGFWVEQSLESAELAQQQVDDGTLSSINLSNEEIEWLTGGYFVVLESFTPQRLMQVLSRSMAGGQQIEPEGLSDTVLVSDGYPLIYTVENFG